MAKRLQAIGLLLACTTLFACGFADPGDGTRTLMVVGELKCTYPDLVTEIFYTVQQNSEPLSGATITLIDGDTNESIEVADSTSAGSYEAVWPGYHRHVKAHVWKGADGCSFQLEGPSTHVIENPGAGVTLQGNQKLDVRWRAPDGVRADTVILSLGDTQDRTHISLARDTGRQRLVASATASGALPLRVRRQTKLTPAGALPGSKVTHAYTVETTVYRQAANAAPLATP